MKTTLVTAPAYMPITLADVKAHLRVEDAFTTDDSYIQSLIFQAVDEVESILNRKLITQTWKYFLDDWPDGDDIVLPYGKLQSVTHVYYTDSDGTQQTDFDENDEWTSDTDSDPGRVILKYGESWPSTTLAYENPIEIQFVCGYGTHAVLTVTGATNASPIVITSGTHGLSTGNRVQIASVGGNTAANGTWIITKSDDNSFSLNGSTGNAAYTSGGTAVRLTVPEPIRQAIRLLVAEKYSYREETITVQLVSGIKGYIINLLWPYRLMSF